MAVSESCKDCKIGRDRGCEGCEQDLFNFDVLPREIKIEESGTYVVRFGEDGIEAALK